MAQLYPAPGELDELLKSTFGVKESSRASITLTPEEESELTQRINSILDKLPFLHREDVKVRYGMGYGYSYDYKRVALFFRQHLERARRADQIAIRKGL